MSCRRSPDMGAPHWRPEARGLVCGLSLDTSRDDVITATLASVAYQSVDLLAALAADGAPVTRLRVDGGMVANDWLCQFLADIAGMRVERPVITETTAFGAGMLAALGGGLVGSLTAAAGLWQLQRGFEPAMSAPQREKLLNGWADAVSKTLGRTAAVRPRHLHYKTITRGSACNTSTRGPSLRMADSSGVDQ